MLVSRRLCRTRIQERLDLPAGGNVDVSGDLEAVQADVSAQVQVDSRDDLAPDHMGRLELFPGERGGIERPIHGNVPILLVPG